MNPDIRLLPAQNALVLSGPAASHPPGRQRSLLLQADPGRPGWLSIEGADVPAGGDAVAMWRLDRPDIEFDPLDPMSFGAVEKPANARRAPSRPLLASQVQAYEVLAATGRLAEVCETEFALDESDVARIGGRLELAGWGFAEWSSRAGYDLQAGLAAFAACPTDCDLASIRWYAAPGREGGTRRQAAASMPLFAGVIARNPRLRACVDRQRPLSDDLRRLFPSLGAAGIRRLGRISSGTADQGRLGEAFTCAGGDDVLGHARRRRLPLEGPWRSEEVARWLEDLACRSGGVDLVPSSDEEWESCSAIWSGFLLPVSTHLGADFLSVRPPGGRWRQMHESISRDLDWPYDSLPDRRDLNVAVVDAVEIADRLAADIILPVIHQTIVTSGEARPEMSIHNNEQIRFRLRRAAYEMLVPASAKQPVRVLSTMVRHGLTRLNRIEELRAGEDCGGQRVRTGEAAGWSDKRWEIPHRGEIRMPNGAVVSFIPDRETLREEGSRMRHCIGRDHMGYWRRCWNGTGTACHIGPGPSWVAPQGERHWQDGATAFLAVAEDGSLSLSALHGYNNRFVRNSGNPYSQAADQFLDMHNCRQLGISEDWERFLAWTRTEAGRQTTTGRTHTSTWEQACGYDSLDAGITEALWSEWRTVAHGCSGIDVPARAVWRSPSARAVLDMISPATCRAMSAGTAEHAAPRQQEAPAP